MTTRGGTSATPTSVVRLIFANYVKVVKERGDARSKNKKKYLSLVSYHVLK